MGGRRLVSPVGVVLIAVLASACTGPNPAYVARVGVGPAPDTGGGAGGTDGDSRRDADGSPRPDTSPPPPEPGRGDAAVEVLAEPLPPADAPASDARLPAETSNGPPDTTPPDVAMLAPAVGRFSLDPGSDSSWLRGGAVFEANPFPGADFNNGGSVTLTGGTAYVTLPVTGLPRFEQSKSVSFWFYVSSVPTEKTFVVVFASSGNAALEFLFIDSVFNVYISGTNGNGDVPCSRGVRAGWNHFAYTYDAGTRASRGYLDGVQCLTSNLQHRSAALTELLLGTVNPGGSSNENLVGRVDDLRIYDLVLSATEVRAIFDGAP